MVRRILPTLIALVILVWAALLTLGHPSFGLAQQFFTGYPTMNAAIAAASLLIWLLIGSLGITGLLWASKVVIDETAILKRRRIQATSIFLIGFSILVMGMVRHATVNYAMCCGSSQEAHQLDH